MTLQDIFSVSPFFFLLQRFPQLLGRSRGRSLPPLVPSITPPILPPSLSLPMRTHATPADRATASPGREPEAVTVGDVLLPSGFPLCSALQRVTERCCPRVAPRSPAPAPAPAARGQRARYRDAPKKKCGTCSSV